MGWGGGALGSRVILGCIRERAGQASKRYSSVNSASVPAPAFLNNGLEAVSQINNFLPQAFGYCFIIAIENQINSLQVSICDSPQPCLMELWKKMSHLTCTFPPEDEQDNAVVLFQHSDDTSRCLFSGLFSTTVFALLCYYRFTA